MSEEAEPRGYDRRLVRFWGFYWPVFAVGLIASAIAGAILVPPGLVVIGEDAPLVLWPFFAWEGGSVSARTAFLPLLLAAAILAGRFSGGGQVPYGFAGALGVILGALSGLYHDGLLTNALLGVAVGVATGLAMWATGMLIRRLWPINAGGTDD